MKRKVKLSIAGRVQGVYFRKFTRQKVVELGVIGSVRNLEDGRVEVIAQAESEVLEKFIQWCHKGPIMARVDNIEKTELQLKEEVNGFEIL